MRTMLNGILYPVIAGSIVVAFSLFLPSYLAERRNLSLEYHVVTYPNDIRLIVGEQMISFLDDWRGFRGSILEMQGADDSGYLRRIIDEIISDQKSFVGQESRASEGVFSSSGIVEENFVRNNDRNRSAEVTIIGRHAGVAIIESSDLEDRVLRGNFRETVELLPGQGLRVVHFKDYVFSNFFADGGSRYIFISSGNRHLSPVNRPTLLNDIFGEWISSAPFLFFILIILGFFAFIVNIFLFVSSFFPAFRLSVHRANASNRDLAIAEILLKETKEKSPDRYSRIIDEAKRISTVTSRRSE